MTVEIYLGEEFKRQFKRLAKKIPLAPDRFQGFHTRHGNQPDAKG